MQNSAKRWRRALVFASVYSVVAAAALVSVVVPGEAVELQAKSEITDVTLYLDRASITRRGTVDAAALSSDGAGGAAHQIRLTGLPANLAGSDIRASVAGAALQSIDQQTVFDNAAENPRARLIRSALDEALLERRSLTDRRDSFSNQLSFIGEFAAAITQGMANGDTGDWASPEDWPASWRILQEGDLSARTEISGLDHAIAELEKKIAALQQELDQLAAGSGPSSAVTLNILADDPAGTIGFSLTYDVANASWQPSYAAKLASNSETVTLERFANITQRTGDDWRDVNLVLATTQPSRRPDPPQLAGWNVDIQRAYAQSRANLESFAADKAVAAADVAQAIAVVETTALQSRFRIADKVTILADGRSRQILIESTSNTAEIVARTVPAQSQHAFVTAQTTLPSGADYLAGPVQLFVDNALVGTGSMAETAAGAPLTFGFGIDPNITVSRRLEAGERSSSGIINRDRVYERSYLIEITNHHDRAIAVDVLEAIPVPRDAQITVTLANNTTQGFEHDAEGIEGLLAWRERLAPEETQLFRAAFRLSHPQDLEIIGFDDIIRPR